MPIKYTQADLQRALEDACIAKIDYNDNGGNRHADMQIGSGMLICVSVISISKLKRR